MKKNTIIQFGEGNFLRCFVDWMIDIMNQKTDFKGEVIIIQPRVNGLVQLLKNQNNTYHTYLTEWQNNKALKTIRKIKCIKDTVDPYKEYTSYLAYAIDPSVTFIVSNTTEAGITFSDEALIKDICPTGFPAKLTTFLYTRYTYFGEDANTITIIPCELIENNGKKLKAIIKQTANHWQLPKAFLTWIDSHLQFCNSLVDRIVPGFPKHNIQEVWEDIGEKDNQVTTGEAYHLWAIEGQPKNYFPTEKANLNVLYTSDLKPYRDRKVRILNGAHTAITSIGLVYGLEAVHEVFKNEDVNNYLNHLIFNEIVPSIDPDSDALVSYAHDIVTRFKNPLIRHELASISLNSISKFYTRLMTSYQEFVSKTNTQPKALVFAYACLLYRYVHAEVNALNDTKEVLDCMTVWNNEALQNEAAVKELTSKLWKEDIDLPDSFYSETFTWYDLIAKKEIEAAFTELLNAI